MRSANLDFTLDKYKIMCQSAIKSGYEIKSVSSYLNNSISNKRIIIMRHDVDRFPKKALRMAILEHSLNLNTTYYFRASGFKQRSIIKSIVDMGHEIGYHYETLDEAKGNNELAVEIFKERLGILRQITKVETICMHGNPLTKWLNSDIWRMNDFHELDLLGEAYLSLEKVWYLSDTGRTWDMRKKVKDFLPSILADQQTSKLKITKTDDVIAFISGQSISPIYITVHPERWSHNFITWSVDEARDSAMNLAKYLFKKLIVS
jgi:hypothetical protein